MTCLSINKTRHFKTRESRSGGICFGGSNPFTVWMSRAGELHGGGPHLPEVCPDVEACRPVEVGYAQALELPGHVAVSSLQPPPRLWEELSAHPVWKHSTDQGDLPNACRKGCLCVPTVWVRF